MSYGGPNDGWKADVKESRICGPIRDDTDLQYDDINILKNQFEGTELPQIKAIEVHHDDRFVHGIQTFYQDSKQTALHLGATHGRVRKERFEL